ncbi:unnamed protein product [marine sediment metagenome]|uniref:Uncharacterized protein n=1 Tax=marine sediment metagenome TaxID=412755 RepID=X1JLI5_9ZZZZ
MNKWKFVAILLIGILIGTIMGGVLFSQVHAGSYDSVYYLKRIYFSIINLESYLSSIEGDVSDIEDYVYWIYGEM